VEGWEGGKRKKKKRPEGKGKVVLGILVAAILF